MKKSIIIITALALAFIGYACDSSSNDTADIAVSTTNVDFGDVRTGESGEETVTVSNDGDINLDDLVLSVSGNGFSISVESMSINVGGSADFTVTFAPEADGDFNGSVTITSENEGLSTTINLAGVGVDAIQGSWVSEGDDIAPGLAAAPFLNVRIDAAFNSDNTYFVESEDQNGSVITFTGTWEASTPNDEGIRAITLEQSEPVALTSRGIFRIDDNRMEYEVIQEGLTGVEPPTQEGGFGSTLVGGTPTGDFWIQKYTRVE